MRFTRTVCGGVLAGVLVAVPASAQTVGGSLQGTITDPSGQAISGAHVLVRNTGTGDTRELVTEPDGRYHAPLLPINGARPEQNNFLLDGTDINNVYNKSPGSAAGVLLGVEAVLEFQVLTNAYSAEFGRSAGGVINAVTRSGANEYHGAAFEFQRNSALDPATSSIRPPSPNPSSRATSSARSWAAP